MKNNINKIKKNINLDKINLNNKDNELNKIEDNELNKIEDNELNKIEDNELNKIEDNELNKIEDNELNKIEDNFSLKILKLIKDNEEKINFLENKIEVLKKEKIDYALRSKAEISNILKRSKIEIEKAYNYSIEKFVYDLLPVVDNLERSLDVDLKNKENLKSLIYGVELTLKSMINVMNKFGIKSIKDVNVVFNPKIHQAMTITETDKYEENIVLSIMQKGYILRDKLIRPALVIVSKKIENK